MAVRSRDAEVTVDATAYPYACIRAIDFYRLADRLLTGDGCSIHRGTSVEEISEHQDGVDLTLRSDDGTQTRGSFAMVFDGRPPALGEPCSSAEPVLFQHFGGIELSVSHASFNPAIATLMDFDVPQDQGTHFMYVLPFSSERVLIESTFLTNTIDPSIDYEANALSYARSRLGIKRGDVVYREAGVLPMTLRPLGPPSTHRIWRIGARAGIGRASSGYAFDAIQRDSRRVVDALMLGRARPAPPRSAMLGALDRILLSWLNADASAASCVFSGLFRSAAPESLIRFLADIPSVRDYLSVMWAMPKARVIQHTITHPSCWPRLL